jgi:hypothetical protein
MRTKASFIAIAVCVAAAAFSQETLQRNLEICLSGKYPALCEHRALTPDQLRQAGAAEKRENLRVCVTGKYPALCDHSTLAVAEAIEVAEAERVENLRVCSTGRYPALCRHILLSPDEVRQVRVAEETQNLTVCMGGRYVSLCNHSLLTPQQANEVAATEAKTDTAAQQPPRLRPRVGECETGHWIESIDGAGKIINLEDGSLWRVNDVDTITTMIWLPVSEVLVCGAKMISIDGGGSAMVTRIAPVRSLDGRAVDTGPQGYLVQASANDETFVINSEAFKAKTYCFNLNKGDRVIFISGSPSGACASARLLNVKTGRTCDAWCE